MHQKQQEAQCLSSVLRLIALVAVAFVVAVAVVVFVPLVARSVDSQWGSDCPKSSRKFSRSSSRKTSKMNGGVSVKLKQRAKQTKNKTKKWEVRRPHNTLKNRSRQSKKKGTRMFEDLRL